MAGQKPGHQARSYSNIDDRPSLPEINIPAAAASGRFKLASSVGGGGTGPDIRRYASNNELNTIEIVPKSHIFAKTKLGGNVGYYQPLNDHKENSDGGVK